MNATLVVGEITQQVEVKGESVGVITTETETVSSAYNSLEITSLPTNYRASGNGNSPYYLLEILPGRADRPERQSFHSRRSAIAVAV